MIKKRVAVATAASFVFAANCNADFSGAFAPANWVVTPSQQQVYFNGTFQMQHYISGQGYPGPTSASITLPGTGILSFDWNIYDYGAAFLNNGGDGYFGSVDVGSNHQQFGPVSGMNNSGSYSLNVSAGQQLSFHFNAPFFPPSSPFSYGYLNITNFLLGSPPATYTRVGNGLISSWNDLSRWRDADGFSPPVSPGTLPTSSVDVVFDGAITPIAKVTIPPASSAKSLFLYSGTGVTLTGGGSPAPVLTVAGGITLYDTPARNQLTVSGVDLHAGNDVQIYGSTLLVQNGGSVRSDSFIVSQTGGIIRTDATSSITAPEIEVFGQLGGFGTIHGPVLVYNGGKFTPGASPGAIEIDGPLSLLPGSILEIEIGSSAQDHVLVDGALDIEPGSELQLKFLDGYVPSAGTTFSFLKALGSTAGSFQPSDVTVTGLPAGNVSYDPITGDVTITPEPTCAALLIFGASVGLRRIRR